MLRPRLIPCLLVQDGGLVKTVRFKPGKYVGDPLNAVRIFNEKAVDELIVLDISATPQRRDPDYELIAALAAECRMPLCYGGGVRSVSQVERIVSLGVEKVVLSTAAIEDPTLVLQASEAVGTQSVVVVLDVKKRRLRSKYEVFLRRGTKNTGLDVGEFARRIEALGAGEIIVNAIDRDGVMEGYDLELAKRLRDILECPLTVLGGAGSLEHVAELYRHCGLIGAAAGSLFVFKGKYRAVLINYPEKEKRSRLWEGCCMPDIQGTEM